MQLSYKSQESWFRQQAFTTILGLTEKWIAWLDFIQFLPPVKVKQEKLHYISPHRRYVNKPLNRKIILPIISNTDEV